MTVYVDDMKLQADVQNGPRTVRGTWSHMVADSEQELIEFAVRLGLRPSYIQYRKSGLTGKRNCHFDLTQSKVKQALKLGAIACTTQEALKVMEAMTMREAK